MRELGETAVGGSASNAGDRFGGNEGRKVSKERSENVARALAFLIARGDMDLSIFKVSLTCIVWPDSANDGCRR